MNPAFTAVIATMLRQDGELNDALEIFFSKSFYCRNIKARTLIVQDPEDPFVPFAHARTAAQRVSQPQLRPFQLAGHIVWLGRGARATGGLPPAPMRLIGASKPALRLST